MHGPCDPIPEIAEQFEPSEQTISNCIAQADRDDGKPTDGLTTVEREELARLRGENRELKLEREILAKAAAWFSLWGLQEVVWVGSRVKRRRGKYPDFCVLRQVEELLVCRR